MSRVVAPLGSERTIELGHHILKAHIYKNISKQRGYSSRDMQALWVALSADNLSASLVCDRNLYSPNVKVHSSMLVLGFKVKSCKMQTAWVALFIDNLNA